MLTIQNLPIERPRAVRHQIRDSIRELIVSGQLAPGTKLPPTLELEAAWKTDANTIHHALAPLVKEGLLVRRPGVGTFVQKREERLTCVGISYPEECYGLSLYLHALHAALKRELRARGIATDIRIDPRPEADLAGPWAPLVRAAEHRDFQALIVPVTDPRQMVWQAKLPVPVAFQVTVPVANGVRWNYRGFAELALQALARQGCRSVGLIMPWEPRPEPTGTPPAFDGFFTHFSEVSQDLGLAIKNSWIRLWPRGVPHGTVYDSFGYEQFRELWRQPQRPDGLVVYDDVVARGVILALQQLQVRVPAELKLALHQNEAVGLLCPVPATFLVSSERAMARALIAQVEKQFRGERGEPIVVDHRLVPPRAINRQPNNQTKGQLP